MVEVIVYSTQTCPYCTMAKDWLKQNNVEFKDFDVSVEKEKLQEMMQKSGQTGVPVLDVGGKIIVGFNEAAIKAALGL